MVAECFLCLERWVSYVLKENTTGTASQEFPDSLYLELSSVHGGYFCGSPL